MATPASPIATQPVTGPTGATGPVGATDPTTTPSPVQASPRATLPPLPADYFDKMKPSELASHGYLNPDALLKYPPVIQNWAKMLAGYSMPATAYMAARGGPLMQRAILAASEYDPSFDEKQYIARQNFLTDISSEKQGTTGGAIVSANKTIGHLNELSSASDALDNRSFAPWNYVANEFEKNVRDDPAVNNYETTAKVLADELTKFFRNSGGSEADIQSKLTSLSPSLGPKNQQGAIKTIVKLMAGQMGALADGYKKTMGHPPPTPLLGDNARKILSHMGFDPDAIESGKYQEVAPPQSSGGVTVQTPHGPMYFADPSKADAYKKAAGIQ